MPQPDRVAQSPVLRRWLQGTLLAALALLCAAILRPFVVPVLWAAILAYTSWPAHRAMLRACRHRQTTAAILTTTVVAIALIVPLLALTILLQNEVAAAYHALHAYRMQGTAAFPRLLAAVPWLGEWVQRAVQRYAADPGQFRQLILGWAQDSHDTLFAFGRALSRNVVKLLITIVTVFFFRDGPILVRQLAQVLQRFFGERLDPYVRAAGMTTRAVIYGLLITAFAQGTIAGVGYAIFSVEAPALLGAMTALSSIVPVFGTLLVWGSVGVSLMLTGHVWSGVGVIAWGSVLVHPVDNVIRPLLISNVTQMPFLLILFGVLGGLGAFGLVGLFIGPVTLAVATAVWREWLGDRDAANAAQG